jgi:hypothetical protein
VIDALAGLERLPLAVVLKNSVWIYPFVNTAHVVGIALLFGAIVPYDLRLLGLWPSVDAAALGRVLLPVAMTGFIVTVGAGGLLFITRAGDYLASPFFLAKMAMLALAVSSAGAALLLGPRMAPTRQGSTDPRLRLLAGLSILVWLAVITLGRLIGYF